MDKEGDPPVVDADILLFDTQKADIRIVGNIIHRYPRHQPGKKGQGEQKGGIEYVGAADNLFYI
jgi:hypothetical protein